jgi:O-antigen ligase
MILSICYSTEPLVSAKYVFINGLHFWVFYFGLYFIHENQIDYKKVLYSYSIITSSIIIYGFIKFSIHDFQKGFAPALARPFYSDHTLFGASLALILPFLIFYRFQFRQYKLVQPVLILLFSLAVLITQSQAVWLSLASGMIAFVLIKKYEVKTRYFIINGLILVCLSSMLLYKVHQNKSHQSGNSYTINTPLNSFIYKLSKDVSTLERINRYSCAIRMWKDRPLLGFGVGTFQFAYLPYQLPSDMTRISVTTARALDGKPHTSGKGGGAHSEYFQAFVELGLIGGITWLLFVIFTIHYSLKMYYSTSPADRFILAIFIALMGYFIHALFNNFLHNEEVSFLFWSMIGWVVISDSGSEIKNK